MNDSVSLIGPNGSFLGGYDWNGFEEDGGTVFDEPYDGPWGCGSCHVLPGLYEVDISNSQQGFSNDNATTTVSGGVYPSFFGDVTEVPDPPAAPEPGTASLCILFLLPFAVALKKFSAPKPSV